MLKIEKKQEGRTLRFALTGELDSVTSPALEREVQDIGDADEVVLDLKDLAYTSSAGLRVIMGLKRSLGARPLQLENIGLEVREVFDMTGSSALLGL